MNLELRSPTEEPRFIKNMKTGSWDHANKPPIDSVIAKLKEQMELYPGLIGRKPENPEIVDSEFGDHLKFITPQVVQMLQMAEQLVGLFKALRGLFGSKSPYTEF